MNEYSKRTTLSQLVIITSIVTAILTIWLFGCSYSPSPVYPPIFQIEDERITSCTNDEPVRIVEYRDEICLSWVEVDRKFDQTLIIYIYGYKSPTSLIFAHESPNNNSKNELRNHYKIAISNKLEPGIYRVEFVINGRPDSASTIRFNVSPTPTPSAVIPLFQIENTQMTYCQDEKTQVCDAPGASIFTIPTSLGTVCPWIPYQNGNPTPALNAKNCLNDLISFGISGDAQRLFFFVDKAPIGIYGVCRDISQKNDLQFDVTIRDNIAAVNFLIAVGPRPAPTRSAYAFKIQPDKTDIYLKFVEYNSAGTETEREKRKAPTYWKIGNRWHFDFALRFDGAKASASINKEMSLYYSSSNPASRYLCLAYQMISPAP